MPLTDAVSHLRSEQDHVRRVYRAMLMARLVEMKLSSLYKAGKIVGGVYIGKGQEAVSASLGAALTFGHDVYAPLIRDQAGRTAFGEDLFDCARSHLGSVKGPMRGRDGNIHRGHPKRGFPAMISHLGSQLSVVAGYLMAKRLRGELDGVVGGTSIGDGATSTGAFHEGMNVIAVEKLPMVVVVVNNQFAYSTPNDRQFACADLLDRAKGYGMAGHQVDGTDLSECLRVIGGAVRTARDGGGPQMVVARMLRLSGHGEHDDASYVPAKLRAGALGRDCMEVAAAQLIEHGVATAAELDAWREETLDQIQKVLAQVQQEPAPDPWEADWNAFSVNLSPQVGA